MMPTPSVQHRQHHRMAGDSEGTLFFKATIKAATLNPVGWVGGFSLLYHKLSKLREVFTVRMLDKKSVLCKMHT